MLTTNLDRNETVELRCVRAAVCFVAALVTILHLCAVYMLTAAPAACVAAGVAWLLWVLLPSWCVVLFEWLAVFALLVGAATLIIVFPLQTLAFAAVVVLLSKLPKLL